MIVGAVMLAYVLFGGMIATTWVQIIKAVLLLGGASLLALLVLSRFGFNPLALFRAAADQYGDGVLAPGRLVIESHRRDVARARADAGHRRAAAHPDALLHGARRADGADVGGLRHGVHRILLPADVHPRLRRDGARRAARRLRAIDAGGNMAAPLLAEAVGGDAFLGFISAVAFATILAVVAGPDAVRRGDVVARPVGERRAARPRRSDASSCGWRAARRCCWRWSRSCWASSFKGQNVAYMVGLAFAIAASANFPGAGAVDLLAPVHDARGADQHDRSARCRR